jgi:hypothetical protein
VLRIGNALEKGEGGNSVINLLIYIVGAGTTTTGLCIMGQPFYAGLVLFVSGMILLISGLYTATVFVQDERLFYAEMKGAPSLPFSIRG